MSSTGESAGPQRHRCGSAPPLQGPAAGAGAGAGAGGQDAGAGAERRCLPTNASWTIMGVLGCGGPAATGGGGLGGDAAAASGGGRSIAGKALRSGGGGKP